MSAGFEISKLMGHDAESANELFEITIRDAFENEGLGHFKEDIDNEVAHKRNMIEAALTQQEPELFFLTAKLNGTVIGVISFGPSARSITDCIEKELHGIGELGSLYVLPDYQGQGVGSALIKAMLVQLSKRGVERFCLDSGYRRAQKKWLRKFGEPYKVVKDYWGPGSIHMVWLCDVADYS